MSNSTRIAVLDYLNAIDDQTWERVCGDQDREEFAALTIDWAEAPADALREIEAAWHAAVAHAATL